MSQTRFIMSFMHRILCVSLIEFGLPLAVRKFCLLVLDTECMTLVEKKKHGAGTYSCAVLIAENTVTLHSQECSSGNMLLILLRIIIYF